MNQETRRCDLCGLPVELPDFWRATKSGVKHFCCEGCRGLYEMLHPDEILQRGEEDKEEEAEEKLKEEKP